MKGHFCERRFGWDCHGLPVENEIDKRDKINSFVEREAVIHIHITLILTIRSESRNTTEDARRSS
jgi:isoleucyl-tRNA synthetase